MPYDSCHGRSPARNHRHLCCGCLLRLTMALGAQRSHIGLLVLIGCLHGLLGSLATSRLVNSFLFDVSATDPLVYVAGSLIVMLMTLLASTLPVFRFTRRLICKV